MKGNQTSSPDQVIAQTSRKLSDITDRQQGLTQVVGMTTKSEKWKDNTFSEELAQVWRSRLDFDYPELSPENRESIICWLLGLELEFNQIQLEIAQKVIENRYRILRRYLQQRPKQAYRKLIAHLSSLALLRNKIRMCVAYSRDRYRSVADVLQEIISELLQSDREIKQQIALIAKCTTNERLQNAMLFASTEEYCLRPVRNQPLVIYRFFNYLRHTQSGGLTKVPTSESIRMVSSEMFTHVSKNPISLLDTQAIAQYEDAQALAEQQLLRTVVKQAFSNYLAEKLGPSAVQWLQLYLQGQSQAAISQILNMEIKQVYRLRDKIRYHAIHVFGKSQSDLVTNWL